MRSVIFALCLSVASSPAWANARITVLMDVLQITEVIEILRSEGLTYAATLDADMLEGRGGAFWVATVKQIYDADKLQETLRASLEQNLTNEQVTAAIDFYGSADGSRIIDLENAARRAMADPEVEQTARNIYRERSSDDPLAQAVATHIAANDLLERNVTGAMSANYQFYKGLSDGHFQEMSEDEILQNVWSQQDAIRSDTEEWLNGFMMMAYQPLSNTVMGDYIEYSQSEDGQALNAALFEGFEIIYRDVSYALGRAVALNAQGDEI